MKANLGRKLIVLLAVALSLLAVAGAQPQRFFGGIGDVDALTFTDDQKLLLATGYLVVEYDLETHAITKIHHPWQRGCWNMHNIPRREAVVTIGSWLRPKVWNRVDGTVMEGEQLIPGIESLPTYPYLGWSPLVACSPDGSLVAILTQAVGSAELSELRIYDAVTMELLDAKSPPGHFINVQPVFSEDGRTVYTAFLPYGRTDSDLNPSLLEWEIPGDTVRIVEGLFPGLYLLGITNGSDGLRYYVGKHASSSCRDSGICPILTYSRGSIITTYWESAILQPFNQDVVFNRGYSAIDICNADCPDISYAFQGCDIIISPHGAYAVQCGELIATDGGKVLHQGMAHMLRFSPDDAFVAHTTYDLYGQFTDDVYLIGTRDGGQEDTIPALPNSFVRDFTTIPKRSLLLGVEESLITAYDMVSGEALKSTRFTDCSPSGVVASPSGSHLAYRDDWNRFVVLGSADELSSHGILLRSVVGPHLVFNPANEHLLVVADSLREFALDPDDYAASPLVRTYDPQTTETVVYTCASYSPDGSVLLAARGGGVHQLHRYRTADGAFLSKEHLERQWDDFCFDPTGSLLLVTENGTRSIYNAQTLEKRYTITGPIHAATFAAEGKLIITIGNDAIKLWRTATGEFLGGTPLISDIVPDTILPSPLEDTVYIADWQRILEWRLPLRAALEHPEELQLDPILKREHTITPEDQNGDGIYDAADVLLAARSGEP